MIDERKLRETLQEIKDPQTGLSLGESKAVQNVQADGQQAQIRLQFGYPIADYQAELREYITEKLAENGLHHIRLELTTQIVAHKVQVGVAAIPGIKNIIAVASGKGGVGKSTVAVNLALALVNDGARVGLLDADIYGPNQPLMLGVSQRPSVKEDKKLEPLTAYGLQTMSIGYLVEPNTPMVWRGPMISTAMEQLLNDTLWDNLDYLVVDLPPGTGDIQLTLAKKVPIAGVVIVTTPQAVALLDARKGLEMFRKVNVPVLGVIENMSEFVCPSCGHHESIFGKRGGEELAGEYDLPLFGRLPLDVQVREDADRGKPTVVADPRGALADTFKQIARRLAARLALQPKNYAAKFPNIVVEEKS